MRPPPDFENELEEEQCREDLGELREQLRDATVHTNDTSHLPPIEEAPKAFPSFRTKKSADRECDLPAPTYY